MPLIQDKQKLQELPMFFILGRPRSGTTLLRTLFDAHPNVAIPLECAFIINMESKYGNVKNWDEEKLLSFFTDVQLHIKFDTWKLNLDDLKADLLLYKGEYTFQDICKVVYLNYNSIFNKEKIAWIGDKNPVYATYTPKLLKLFPDAKFIHLMRDPRDNIISLKNVDFEGPFVALLAYRWVHSAKRIFRLKQKYPERFYTIRYEDLVKDPHRYYREMCDFLNVPFNSLVFDFYKRGPEVLKAYNVELVMKYHKSLLSPINADKVDVWKKQLPETDIRVTENVAGGWLEKYGYERRFRKTDPVAFMRSVPWLLYGWALYFVRDVIDLFPFHTKIRIKNNGPMLARLFVKVRNADT